MTLLIVLLLLSLVLVGIAMLLAFVVAPYVLAWFLGRKMRDATNQRDSEGQGIRLSRVAQSGLVNLDPALNFVAQLGESKAPETSLDQIVMRPTPGLRMISLVLTATLVFVYLAYPSAYEMLGTSPWPVAALGGLLLYCVAFVHFYSLRYDREGFTAPGLAFQSRSFRWRDVESIQDNGHYLYVVRTHTGEKIDIQKFLIGMRDFLTYARHQIDYHAGRH